VSAQSVNNGEYWSREVSAQSCQHLAPPRLLAPVCATFNTILNDRMAEGKVDHSAQRSLTNGVLREVSRILSNLSYLMSRMAGVTLRRES